MQKYPMIEKCLAVGIILLFVGVAVVPSINANNPKTSSDNELVVVVQTDKFYYQIGEPVNISIYVENHGDKDVNVVFYTSQMADYWIKYCFLWSLGKVFLQMPMFVAIPSGGQILLLNDRWAQVDSSGNKVIPGEYSIAGWMVQTNNYSKIYAEPVDFRIGTEINIGVHGGIGATVSITNKGPFDTTHIQGDILITGGVFGFINISKSFSAEYLGVNNSLSKTLHPLGVGPIEIEMSVYSSNTAVYILKAQMLVILFIVYPIIPPYETMGGRYG
jgi:hypothetical protein